MLVEVGDEMPIICDLGTGLRYLGWDLMARREQAGTDEPFRATALVSHLHWDHIQGIPFFRPLLSEGAVIDMYGPSQPGSSLKVEFCDHIRPPVFPVPLGALPGTVNYHDVHNDVVSIGSATVTSFSVPHVGPTNGYRIDADGGSVAFICDHQQPIDGSLEVPPHIVEACAGVDVLIHDAQFSAHEFALNPDWGHCTPDFALEVAYRSEVKRLALFHHDPAHDDQWIRDEVCRIQALAGSDIEIIGAAEGLTLHSGS
ncbi:MAG: MBL fold metallo-hydrolase [Actinomycetia bacterium]|nr:MBL fold metallo-hydrolase [Actinomycetes bacterium]